MADPVFLGLVHAAQSLLLDIGFYGCRVSWNLLHWSFDRRKILSVLEGRNDILYFSTYPEILNNDLHIVVHSMPLNSQKAICPRALLGFSRTTESFAEVIYVKGPHNRR